MTSHLRFSIDIGAMIKQETNHIYLSKMACSVQRRVASLKNSIT